MAAVLVPASSTAPPAAKTSTCALGFGACFVHGQSATAFVSTVQGGNRGVRFAIVRHFDKAETTRTTGITIGNHSSAFDCAMRLKPLPQVRFGCVEREISDKYFLRDCSSVIFGYGFRDGIERERLQRTGYVRSFRRVDHKSMPMVWACQIAGLCDAGTDLLP